MGARVSLRVQAVGVGERGDLLFHGLKEKQESLSAPLCWLGMSTNVISLDGRAMVVCCCLLLLLVWNRQGSITMRACGGGARNM